MMAASLPLQRPPGAKLLVAGRRGRLEHWRRADFVRLFRSGDLVIANDAATLPACLSGQHVPSGRDIEVRLAGRDSLEQVTRFSAVLFGRGDFRTRTEDWPLPPAARLGDRLTLGPLQARIVRLHDHPRLVGVEFEGSPGTVWEGLARHGRPIQYSHVPTPLALWDTWTSIAGPPVAFEPPSSGFVLDWDALAAMTRRGVRFATITHAAGISSTGTPRSMRCCPSMNPIGFRHPPPRPSARLARAADASSRSEPRSSAHSSTQARSTRSC